MVSWWLEFPPKLRRRIALTLILISTVLTLAGEFWPWGWGFGVVLWLFSGADDAERNGYRW